MKLRNYKKYIDFINFASILIFYVLKIYRDISHLDFERTVVTVGSFDGVHCGHRMLLQRVVDLAAQHRLRSVVVTFWPHPRQTLNLADDTLQLLNTLDERISLLEQTGIDDVVIFPFDKDLSQMSASAFIRDIIIAKLRTQYMVVGQDHHFGKGRGGNVQLLPEIVSQNDLQVEVVDLKMIDQKISSSDIRKTLLCGDLLLANKLLGYDYIISGKVIGGNRLGRTIGFPTANIETPRYKLLPKNGVYRVKVKTEDENQKSKIGMLYIGKRTMLKQEDTDVQVEVYIFDFDQQIYGQKITMSLTHRIRDDIRFGNVEQLATQLQQDQEMIMTIS